MPGRPKVGQALPRNRLLEYLGNMMAGKTSDLSGVNISDTSNPTADDINKLYGTNPQDADVSPDSNTLTVRPSVTPTHWWNQGKADSINNKLKLQDYADRIGIQNAVTQQNALTPGLVSREGQMANATLPSRLAIGNAGVLNAHDILSMGDNADAYNKLTLVNALGAANTGLQAKESGNVLENNKNLLADEDQLRTHPTSANTLDNVANLGLIKSKSDLDLFGENTKNAQALAAAKVLEEQNRAKSVGNIPIGFGGGVYNSVTGTMDVLPAPKPPTIEDKLKSQIFNIPLDNARLPSQNSVTGGVQPTMQALPKLNAAPTDYSKDQYNVLDPAGSGKKGSIINGIFIPLRNQPSIQQ